MKQDGADGELGKPDEDPAPISVECRPGEAFWVLPGLLVFLGLFFLVAPLIPPRHDCTCGLLTAEQIQNQVNSAEYILGWGAAMLTIALEMVYWLIHARIVADEHGIRYRRWFGWHSVPWCGVRDFHEKPLPSGSEHRTLSVIETFDRTFSLSAKFWTHTEELRTVVARYATSAPCAEWGMQGVRTLDVEPLEFVYRGADLKTAKCTIGVGMLTVCGFFTMMWPHIHFATTVATMGWGWALGDVAMLLTLPLIWSLKILIHLPHIRKTGDRLRERITTTPHGIACDDGKLHLEVAWNEVLHYGHVPAEGGFDVGGVYQIVTTHGIMSFRHSIHNIALLKAIISHRAAPGGGDWHHQPSEILGEEGIRTRECPKRGAVRRYDYWNRTIRAMLWIPVCYGCIFVFLPLPPNLHSDGGFNPGMTGFGLVILVGTFWVRHSLKSMRVCIYLTKKGIGQTGFFRSKFIPWNEVVAFAPPKPGNTTYSIVGKSATIKFGSGINYCSELKAELERKVPKPSGVDRRV